jgi:hypothetical protein
MLINVFGRCVDKKYRNAATASLALVASGSGSGSGQKLVSKVLATVSNKRKAGADSVSRPTSNKRQRSEEVIVIDSDVEETTSSAADPKKVATAFGGSKLGNGTAGDIEELDHAKIIKYFKLDPKKLSWVDILVALECGAD